MSIWTPNRIGAFLLIWTLLWPVYVIIIYHTSWLSTFIYAALWGYLPGYPLWNSPFGVDALLTMTMLPFCIPGIMIAYLAYRTIKKDDLSKGQYLLAVTLLQVIQMTVIWLVMPRTISSDPVLCLPTPITGFVAMPFFSKLERLAAPWDKKSTIEDLENIE